MSSTGAHTSVSVVTKPSTPIEVRVSGEVVPLVSIQIGASGHGVSILVSDEETLNALAAAVGEARAKFAGAVVRANRRPVLPGMAVL